MTIDVKVPWIDNAVEGKYPIDTRKLDEINFAVNIADPAAREKIARRMREVLASWGCETATDVMKIGCTGVIAKGLSIEEARNFRDNMAGSGIALTCWVGHDHFCHVHETIGALEPGLEPLWPAALDLMSRPLTEAEAAKLAYMDSVIRTPGKSMAERQVNAALKMQEDNARGVADVDHRGGVDSFPPVPSSVREAGSMLAAPALGTPPQVSAPALDWKCPEHTKFQAWCRFCLAERIVAGPLDPACLIDGDQDFTKACAASQVVDQLIAIEEDETDIKLVSLYVKVAGYRRGLALVDNDE